MNLYTKYSLYLLICVLFDGTRSRAYEAMRSRAYEAMSEEKIKSILENDKIDEHDAEIRELKKLVPSLMARILVQAKQDYLKSKPEEEQERQDWYKSMFPEEIATDGDKISLADLYNNVFKSRYSSQIIEVYD